jgi:hypothetical protein
MKHWMFCCKDVSRKFSESMDWKLPVHERMLIRMHQLMCRYCARFRRQLLLLRELSRSDKLPGVTQKSALGLSPDARARIKSALKAG